MDKNYSIYAHILYDGKTKKEDVTVRIEGDVIVDVAKGKSKCDIEGYVTPAFIDAHSHIGMIRQGEPSDEQEANDKSDQINPLNNPLNSVYFDDRAFVEAVDFGVLYSCIVPGSGNLVGGKAMIVKNYESNRKDALLKEYGYKMALGYNPRSTGEWKGARPNTRMGVYRMLENAFDTVLKKAEKAKLTLDKKIREADAAKKENKITSSEHKQQLDATKKEHDLEFSVDDLALLDLLSGKKTVKVHVHKEDDVYYLIDLVKKYGFKATADHTCDVDKTEVFDACAKAGLKVVYGPLGSLDYKVELKHAYYKNTKHLMNSKVFYGLMTDHPVIMTTQLRDTLKYFLIQGMKPEEAISLITYKNASILGIDDKLGTVEKGKWASLVVWTHDPLHLGAFPKAVFAEGRKVR